jgi:hypothetical protein
MNGPQFEVKNTKGSNNNQPATSNRFGMVSAHRVLPGMAERQTSNQQSVLCLMCPPQTAYRAQLIAIFPFRGRVEMHH